MVSSFAFFFANTVCAQILLCRPWTWYKFLKRCGYQAFANATLTSRFCAQRVCGSNFFFLNTNTKDLVCYVVYHVDFVYYSMGSNYREIAMLQCEGPWPTLLLGVIVGWIGCSFPSLLRPRGFPFVQKKNLPHVNSIWMKSSHENGLSSIGIEFYALDLS